MTPFPSNLFFSSCIGKL